ncbi:MAG: hypothetical protein AAF078_02360, partial [Planctomycetota bacterium]
MSIANPISPDHDALRDDVRMLGHELGAVLRDLGEPGLYEQVETVRAVGDRPADGGLHCARLDLR